MALFKKKQLVLGIDISPSAVKLIELSRTGQRYKVEAIAFEPLPQGSMENRNPVDLDQVSEAIKRVVYWTPRTLCILFAVFISLFALDVFEEGKGFWETSVALLLHLVPTIIIVAVLVVSWRREWIGGILFIALGIFYVVWAWGRFHWAAYAFISGPLLLMGILFLLNWRHRAVLHAKA